jgi:CubicO group peptidase (beta-lactamase class C family)
VLGSAIHDGGVSATARDLARFGQMLIDDGMAQGYPVVPRAWLAGTRAPEPGVREAFAGTDHEFVLPGGWYRNQFWVIPGAGGPVLVCLGIHGQLVYAHRAARTVVSSCRPGRTRSTPATCWTRCARAPRWRRTWRHRDTRPRGRSVPSS